jgi:hypothetical protein
MATEDCEIGVAAAQSIEASLNDCISTAATHRLENLKSFELRMVEVKRLVPASVPLQISACSAIPSVRNRAIVLVLGPLEQMELNKSGYLA